MHATALKAGWRFFDTYLQGREAATVIDIGSQNVNGSLKDQCPAQLKVAERLAAMEIETRRWYCPTLERHPAFREYPVAGELRVSAMINERLLALPYHVFLAERDIEAVFYQ